MSKKQNLYTGRSGQFAVMAEFLRRGYNVAIPEIDIGEDILPAVPTVRSRVTTSSRCTMMAIGESSSSFVETDLRVCTRPTESET
jgi:hypothetical protein